MEKRKIIMAAKRMIAIMLAGALLFGMELPGVYASYMPVQRVATDEAVGTDKSGDEAEVTEEQDEAEVTEEQDEAEITEEQDEAQPETKHDASEQDSTNEEIEIKVAPAAGEIYKVTTDVGEFIDVCENLEDAVTACPDNTACTITALHDDEITAVVEIPEEKKITLTSSADEQWTITQKATTTSTSAYTARHFCVRGSLTLENIILSGMGNTDSDTYNGGVFVYGSSAKLLMIDDAAIIQCSNYYGGGVYVYEYSTFEMEEGEISGNEAGSYGGGVYVYNNGTFEMEDGEISGNEAGSHGGGVFIQDNGAFKMIDGTISGNGTENYGGGVCVYDNGMFEMEDGEISGNEAGSYGGGVFVHDDGMFEMTDGTISGNGTENYGGGVCIADSTFKMTGGEISRNKAGKYGGGVFVYDNGAFEMEDGKIGINQAESYGGGVCVADSGTFEMTGGKVRRNKADYGGGVSIYGGSTFEITDGEISRNKAGKYGGGVYVVGNSEFEMTDSLVTGNTASDGGGIFTADYDYSNPVSTNAYSNITIGDNALVTGNTASAKYGLPVNYAEFSDSFGELLNNDEINYKGNYLVQYDANNGSYGSKNQEASSGTGSVEVTLLTESDAGFTAPDGKELTGWNTEKDGTGDNYDPGAEISIEDSITLYAVWGEPRIYIVTTETKGDLIGTYPTLAEAVDACLTTEACVITATQDDEIDAYVTIPSTKNDHPDFVDRRALDDYADGYDDKYCKLRCQTFLCGGKSDA